MTLSSGQASFIRPLFTYDGIGDAPYNAPTNVIGFRRIGQQSSVTLRWLYSDTDYTGERDVRFYETVQEFEIQVSTNGDFSGNITTRRGVTGGM